MIEKVAKIKLIREDHIYIYFIRNGDVWRILRKGSKSFNEPEKITNLQIEMDNRFIYYLDKDGDISRIKR